MFDPLATVDHLALAGRDHRFASLARARAAGLHDVDRLPWCLRVLLENVLRHAALGQEDAGQALAVHGWLESRTGGTAIRFRPSRVMMDDTAGLPLIGELAALRDAAAEAGRDPRSVDLALPLDFVVDHSIIADHTGSPDAESRNQALELKRNAERYGLLRWAAQAFDRLTVFPPGSGICHQIHLEHIACVVATHEIDRVPWLAPDTMVGIDSHTPMVNGLGVLGFGVSGLEGLAAALGEPVTLRLPPVVGVRLLGELRAGVLATDLVLTLVARLRDHGVVGKVVEYHGPGVGSLSVADRATVANMTPECGATLSSFPIDAETLRYLRETGRSDAHVAVVERYARAQGLWWTPGDQASHYSEMLTLDLATVKPTVSGPRFPHARIDLDAVPGAFRASLAQDATNGHASGTPGVATPTDGAIAIAAITSCTNTSNPEAMLAAGLVARNAAARGLAPPAWVKTSLSPGSRVVGDYLARAGLLAPLEALGFHIAGHGCMTCVGFSGPLLPAAQTAMGAGVRVAAMLSGNRNYDGRVHADVHASFLASPPLVVAWALAGTVERDLTREPIGHDFTGQSVFLSDLWPDPGELRALMAAMVAPERYRARYATILDGPPACRAIAVQPGPRFAWPAGSAVLRRPPSVDDPVPRPIVHAALLAVFGDQVTTEHISPMGPIPAACEAARYLEAEGVSRVDHGTYAGRRLNHDVMLRGTFASPHLVNRLVPESPGGWTRHHPSGERLSMHAAAQRYRSEGRALVVVAGRDYGTGSSRDWSAKGPRGLGVRAIIAESFERIHRGNLVAAGVLPLALAKGMRAAALGLDGTESIDLAGIAAIAAPLATTGCTIRRRGEDIARLELTAMLETQFEVELFSAGGLVHRLQRGNAKGGREKGSGARPATPDETPE